MRILVPLMLVFVLLAGAGCSTMTLGNYVPNSQFSYPNSNVKPLGPTSATISKTKFFLAPELTPDDIRAVYNEALGKVDGANILVNFKQDTTYTSICLFNTIEYRLEGEAAKMDVGQQSLK